jgi:chitodextrinase
MKKTNILKIISLSAALALSYPNAAAQCDYADDFFTSLAFNASGFNTINPQAFLRRATTAGGWTVVNVLPFDSVNAATNFIPKNKRAVLLNGSVAHGGGAVTSPVLGYGCSAISFKWSKRASKLKVKLLVAVTQGANTVWQDTLTVSNAGSAKTVHQYAKNNLNVTGAFQLIIKNLCPRNSSGMKPTDITDDVPLWDVCLAANPTAETFPAPAVSVGGVHPRAEGGWWDSACVSLACPLPNTAIYYTTNGSTPTAADSLRYAAPFEVAKTTQVKAIAVRGALTSAVTDSTATVASPTFSFVVPKEATVFVGAKSQAALVAGRYLKKHYVPFTEKQPAYEDTLAGGQKQVFYGVSGAHAYRVSMPGKLTHVGRFTPGNGSKQLEVTQAQLSSRSPKEVDHDVNSLNGRNHSDVYLNINAAGRLRMAKDSSFYLMNIRVWQAIDDDVSNYFMEPDFHHYITNEQGVEDSSVVAILPDGTIKAKKAGTAIVRVTYDAMMCSHTANVGSNGSAFFGALWPENTGVFVVTVSDEPTAPATGIAPNMTIGELWNSGGTDRDSTFIDAEHDVLYYEASTGGFGYTFKPAGVASVTLAQPALSDATLSYGGFSANGVTAHPDGSYTVRLVHGRNIVKLTNAAGASEYQVISAKPVTWTVSGQSDKANKLFRPGDTISVRFGAPTAPGGKGYPLYHPANKLSGVYNMSAGIQYLGYPTDFPLILGPGQYTFASRAQSYQIIIPRGYTGEEIALTNGVIKVQGFGSSYGDHRKITKKNGVSSNLNAIVRTAYCGSIPSIYFRLTDTPSAPEAIVATPDGETALNLSWKPSRDNGSIDGYYVYKNGALADYVAATSYKLQGLTPGTAYLIEVEAEDDRGKQSKKAQLTATTRDLTPPAAPSSLRATKVTETTAALAWAKASDNSGAVAKYVVYLNGKSVAEAVDTTCTVTGLSAVTTYAITVAAVDAAGNESAKSDSIVVHTPDQTPPTRPGIPRKTSETATSVTLLWRLSSDNVGVAGYLVTLATADNLAGDSVSFVAHTNATTYSCTVGNLPAAYIIGVQAVDTSGNRSQPAYFSRDGEAPSAPANLSATPTDTSVALSWAAATDNLGLIAGYIVYLNGDSTGIATGTSHTLIGLAPATEYALAVAAVDVAGNRSAKAQVTVSTTAAATTTTGVRQADGSAAIAYPNPFGSYLVVKAAADGEAVFYNMRGEAVLRAAVGAGSNRIGTSALPQGAYLVSCGSLMQMMVKN